MNLYLVIYLIVFYNAVGNSDYIARKVRLISE
jgi:hypothetical protein